MANPTGKTVKGRPQRNKLNRGKDIMKDYFKPTQTAAKTANNLANTNAFARLADDADDAASITSIKSNASNNAYAGAVTNTNTPDTKPGTNPVYLEGKVDMTPNKDPNGTWTTVPPNKSPPRARSNEKRNRVATPTKKKQSDTITKKVARKQLQNPMSTTPDRSEHHKQNPSVVTGEKPEKPLPPPPESPPKLDRNPRLPEPAVTPQSVPDPSSNQQANAPKDNKSHDPEKDAKTALTQDKGKSNPNKGKHNKNKNGKGKKRDKKQQVKFMVHPYAINTKAPATKSYLTLITKIRDTEPLDTTALTSDILTELATYYTGKKDFKTIFPTDPKDMDRAKLQEFITEAMRKTSRIRRSNSSMPARGTKLIRHTIQGIAHLTVKDMEKFPN